MLLQIDFFLSLSDYFVKEILAFRLVFEITSLSDGLKFLAFLVGMKPNARKSENEKFLRDVKLISMGTKDAFDGFRQQEGYDSDCDEEMECD